ncbi:MAG TPA: transketolase [Spirochaeta sp.]|nr:transketolase [Spirochaeta sp.]
MTNKELRIKAVEARMNIVKMTTAVQGGHLAGSLSCIDLLIGLFFNELRFKADEPEWKGRDRFVLSKGHGAPALYTVLAMADYFPLEELYTLRKINSRLQGHPACYKLPGIEICTGSLGTGFSAAVGMALGYKLDNDGDKQVFTLLGDGENDEGQVWEAAMAASHFNLNITAIIDRNRYQIDGSTSEVMELEPLSDKWRAFGWNVVEIDGHSIDDIVPALKKSRGTRTVIIAETTKGKGISLVENNNAYHSKPLSQPDSETALAELENRIKEIENE